MAEQQEVYVGLWRDYSYDGLRQLTLTVSLTHGGYLISIMTLLVSLAGSRFWYIMTYIIHQLRAHPDKRTDPVHAQTQTLLRNSITASSTIADALLMCIAWSGTGMHAGRRLIPIMTVALACLVAFTLAGTFVSSAVTQKTPDVVVLAKAPGCGAWDVNGTALSANIKLDPNATKILAQDSMDARLYAKWFYADMPPSSIPTSRYPIKKLPYSRRMVPCPFTGENRCLSNDTSSENIALTLDTGMIDSHFHLGLNAPAENRLEVRKLLTCAPVNVDDLIDINVTDSGGIVNLTRLTNYDTDVFSINKRVIPLTSNGYSAGCNWYSGILRFESWPAEPFVRDDADLSLCFVSQESVMYPEPVYDPLFLANGSRMIPGERNLYLGNNYLNVIACLDQIQFCNPATGKCTNVTHPAAAWIESQYLDLNEHQLVAINRTTLLAALTGTSSYGLGSLGVAGLQARDLTSGDQVSTALPNNQWQTEAKLWFETSLALLQGHIIRFLGRIDLSSPHMYGRFLIYKPFSKLPDGPLRDASETACKNQKITTTNRYQNFNFAAMMVIVSFSLLIILVSFVFESVIVMVREAWVTRKGQWRQNEWDTNSQYWLLRTVMEGAGIGPWRMGGKTIKVGIPVVDRSTAYEHLKRRDVELDDFLQQAPH